MHAFSSRCWLLAAALLLPQLAHADALSAIGYACLALAVLSGSAILPLVLIVVSNLYKSRI